MQIIEGERFFKYLDKGSMGVVTDTRFVRCFWPRLDRPTMLFAEGSSGLEVQGPPTPRNVVFPPDTVFLLIEINDAQVGAPHRWRKTDIATKPDSFFVRTTQDGAELIEHLDAETAISLARGN